MKHITKNVDYNIKNRSFQKTLSKINLVPQLIILNSIKVMTIAIMVERKIVGSGLEYIILFNNSTAQFKNQLFQYNSLKQYKDNL
jgi:hypothetical protein